MHCWRGRVGLVFLTFHSGTLVESFLIDERRDGNHNASSRYCGLNVVVNLHSDWDVTLCTTSVGKSLSAGHSLSGFVESIVIDETKDAHRKAINNANRAHKDQL